MRKINFVVFTLLAVILGTSSSARAGDNQLWTIVTATGTFDNSKARYTLEVQPRYDQNGDRIERLILRGGLGYPLAPGLIGWVGYGWFPQYQTLSADKDFTNENRLWQQITYDHEVERVSLHHRARLEQRLIGDEPQVSNRGRYLLRGSVPLGEHRGVVFGITMYDEIFLNLRGMDRGPIGGFDRNRIMVGPYVSFNNYRGEFGYLREEARARGGSGRDINAWILSIGINL